MIVKRKQIHRNDIILGRGGALYKHAGNQFLRDLATSLAPTYIHSSKGEKSRLSRQMVDIVTSQEPPGRFLKLVVGTNNTFEEVHCSVAREKTSQCLRDAVKSLVSTQNKKATINKETNSISSSDKSISDYHYNDNKVMVSDNATPYHPFHHTTVNLPSYVHDARRTSAEQRSCNPTSREQERRDLWKHSYPYPQQDQYRMTYQLPSCPPTVKVPFGDHNCHKPPYYPYDTRNMNDQSLPQSQQWSPITHNFRYQRDRQKHYTQTPSHHETAFSSHIHTMEKNVMRPHAILSIEPISVVVSNDNDHRNEHEKDKVVDNYTSMSTIVSPYPSSHPYSSNDPISQNSNSNQKRQKLTNNNHVNVTPGGIELNATKDTQSNNKNIASSEFDQGLLYLTKSTSRSFDSNCDNNC